MSNSQIIFLKKKKMLYTLSSVTEVKVYIYMSCIFQVKNPVSFRLKLPCDFTHGIPQGFPDGNPCGIPYGNPPELFQ